jgi:thioredoxin:protein disulfide reductase
MTTKPRKTSPAGAPAWLRRTALSRPGRGGVLGVVLLALVWLGAAPGLRAQDPFGVEATLRRGPPARLEVTFRIPADHILYVHMIHVEPVSPASVTLKPTATPPAKRKYDEVLGTEVSYYDADVTLPYEVDGLGDRPLTVAVSYQGCSANVCFLPQRREIVAGAEGSAPPPAVTPAAPRAPTDQAQEWRALADQFDVVDTTTGYLPPRDFIGFLKGSKPGTAGEPNVVERVFRRYGLLAALLLVVPLGLLLNLTPCVLPMIPVNLAIIGAGQTAGSERAGLSRGAIYGAGMALAYGALGAIVVLTGSRFGALNASPWFNAGVAIVFVGLALAMFDVVTLDFSRFQRGGAPGRTSSGKLPSLAIFLLGATAALLAGACVAPVLIWVLLLAASLYSQGHLAGLLLPLMLGVGMALPWPVAGAGLAVLPRPGAWMNRVKYGMGVLILLFAAYYGALSVRLFHAQAGHPGTEAGTAVADTGWVPDLTTGLRQALGRRQPAVLDFWALTCKSCLKMDKTTFKDPEVIQALAAYTPIAIQTDNINDPLVRGALDYYHVLGLPTYIILRPKAP